MTLIVFMVFGLAVGYLLSLSRRGLVMIAMVFISAALVELVHLLLTTQQESLTFLPLVLGLVTVVCMLLGAWARHHREDNSSAA